MPRRASDISRAIRSALRVLDRDISADPLTVERKIIDTVAESIAEAELDQYVIDYQFDIDAKAGDELDKFVALFGFARQEGKRARGTVTFTRSAEAATAATPVIIPPIQVRRPGISGLTPAINFQTLTTAIMYSGVTEAEVEVESVEIGEQGNVPAGVITVSEGLTAYGITELINANPTTGGKNAETDAELRARFRRTIFRNLAGTRDQYLALGIASRYSTKAIVLGPQSRYVEQLQIASGAAKSEITYSKYAYDFDYYLTDGAPVETFYHGNGVDFSFAANKDTAGGTVTVQTWPITLIQPEITVVDTIDLPNNTIVYLEHTYCSANSRNDPFSQIYNAVDVYVGGSDPVSVSETLLFPSTTFDFNTDNQSAYWVAKYERVETGNTPTVGNRFQELLRQPVIDLPDSIQIGNNTYLKNEHYWFVQDISPYRGSRRARCGIEWSTTVTGAVTAGTSFTLLYTFNRLPMTINEMVDAHKPVGKDVLVHEAIYRYFIVNLTIMYLPGYSHPVVREEIDIAIRNFFERQYFGSNIQFSDLESIAHSVAGVDNVRISTSADGGAYGITEWAAGGTISYNADGTIDTTDKVSLSRYTGTGNNIWTSDFQLQDAHLPVLVGVNITPRSVNTWT